MAFKIPKKNIPLDQADMKDLDYWGHRLHDELEEDPNGEWSERNRKLLEAIRAEVKRRKAGGQQRQAPPPEEVKQAEVPWDLAGQLTDPAAITERIKKLSESCNLISPAPACSQLPVGGAVLFTFVTVDPTVIRKDNSPGDGPDVYEQKGGGFSLKKHVLTRIANAAGVHWVFAECKRLDDCKNPRFARHQSVGRWQDFDGNWITKGRSKTVDLRDGSDQIPSTMSEKQLANKRATINEVVESGSMTRVVRELGIKHVYSAEELSKAFAIIRFMFTGVTEDQDLKVPLAMMKAYQMTGGEMSVYGPRAGSAGALGPAAPPPAQLGGHVVDSDGVVHDYENDDRDERRDYDDTGTDDDGNRY